ncbi:MAG: RidA family protein [Eubacteriales bacterium]|nr:RidA family protein [Eubacteriales bacterium]
MKDINTVNAPKAIGPYVQAKRTGNMLFVSGQIPVNPETSLMPEGIKAQTEQSLKNLKAILEEAGFSMENVIKAVCFLSDMANFNAFNEVYAEFFKDNKPARSCVAVKDIPKGAMVEVEAIAVID